MKKIICIFMAVMMVMFALMGCSANQNPAKAATTGKVVINFEGTVAAVDGNEITLESGKVIVISENTVFGGDVDTNVAVSEEIDVGNFIQGYTEDDPEADRITAAKVYCNAKVNPAVGKLVINFEGKIVSISGNEITLDSGKTITVTEATVYSVAGGSVENIVLCEGYTVQGYAEGTASRIHIIF
ncbi:MAG: hypothetical protein IJ306_05470 [Oscillospiraceae bacterium]|nr:hypothetical protein [Oscillospiraceae bacterium]